MFDLEKQMVEAVRSLAAKSPNNIYTSPDSDGSCYNHIGTCTDGSTGCIIGQATRICNVRIPNIGGVMMCFPQFKGKIQLWLMMVQDTQDAGGTWIQAVEKADTFHSILHNPISPD